jgi:predicted O-linked N-acetylglucosamine transferase (SPINDLY family)
MTWEEQLKTASEHHVAGRLDEAQFLYRQVLAVQPDHPDALRLAGVVSFQLGRKLAAVELLERAIASNPRIPESHCDLGIVLFELQKIPEAITCYKKAIALSPEFAEAHYNLGIAHYSQGRLDDAIAAYCVSLESRPDDSETLVNLGNALHAKGEHEAAARAFQRAIELHPDSTEAYNNLGNSLLVLGLYDRAVGAYRDAIDLKPDNFQSHVNLGIALRATGKLNEALRCIDQAIELRPDLPAIHSARIDALHEVQEDPAVLLAESMQWDQRHVWPLKKLWKRHTNDRSPDRRLRIGYISANFRSHEVGRNLLPLWREHDREQYEPYFYSDVMRPDRLTERISSFSDHWTNIVGQSDGQVAEAIERDQIDILVDLTMHAAGNRLLVFGRKPAPLQIALGPYPGGTGLRAMDYRLTDPYLDPPGETDHYHVEISQRLADSFWCYDFEAMDLVNTPKVGPLPAAKNQAITFGSLNNFSKITDAALGLWARVLDAAPGSRLLLTAPEGSARQRIVEMAGDRIEFADWRSWQSRKDYFQTFQRIDIGLDTFPCNGQASSLDSLWMGVPIVTLVGRSAIARAGFSLLSNLGLMELAAHDEAQFVKIAAELATDLPRLRRLRWTLRNKMRESPLMDGGRYARNVEAAYRTMWLKWCDRREQRKFE